MAESLFWTPSRVQTISLLKGALQGTEVESDLDTYQALIAQGRLGELPSKEDFFRGLNGYAYLANQLFESLDRLKQLEIGFAQSPEIFKIDSNLTSSVASEKIKEKIKSFKASEVDCFYNPMSGTVIVPDNTSSIALELLKNVSGQSTLGYVHFRLIKDQSDDLQARLELPDDFLAKSLEGSPVKLRASLDCVNLLQRWGIKTVPSSANPPRKILLLTAGGNSPGQNAVLKSFEEGIVESGIDLFAVHGGVFELARPSSEKPNLHMMKADEIADIDETATSNVHGTSRSTENHFDQIHARILSLGVDMVVVMGGDGSLTLARKLAERGIKTVGIPKTMDGNLAIRHKGELKLIRSVGFESSIDHAAHYVEILKDRARREKKIFIMEVNGRDTGWIARETSVRTGVPYFADEMKPTIEQLENTAQGMSSTGGVILVSESTQFYDHNEKEIPFKTLRTPSFLAGFENNLRSDFSMRNRSSDDPKITVRAINLGALIPTTSLASKKSDMIDWLYKLTLSAQSQGRLNIVKIPASVFYEVKDMNWTGIKFMQGLHYADGLYPTISHDFEKGVRVLVFPDSAKILDLQDNGNPEYDQRGRISYQTRLVAPTLASYLQTKTKTPIESFVATNLLMAESTSAGELSRNRKLGKEIVKKIVAGESNFVLSSFIDETDGNFVTVDLDNIHSVRIDEVFPPETAEEHTEFSVRSSLIAGAALLSGCEGTSVFADIFPSINWQSAGFAASLIALAELGIYNFGTYYLEAKKWAKWDKIILSWRNKNISSEQAANQLAHEFSNLLKNIIVAAEKSVAQKKGFGISPGKVETHIKTITQLARKLEYEIGNIPAPLQTHVWENVFEAFISEELSPIIEIASQSMLAAKRSSLAPKSESWKIFEELNQRAKSSLDSFERKHKIGDEFFSPAPVVIPSEVFRKKLSQSQTAPAGNHSSQGNLALKSLPHPEAQIHALSPRLTVLQMMRHPVRSIRLLKQQWRDTLRFPNRFH